MPASESDSRNNSLAKDSAQPSTSLASEPKRCTNDSPSNGGCRALLAVSFLESNNETLKRGNAKRIDLITGPTAISVAGVCYLPACGKGISSRLQTPQRLLMKSPFIPKTDAQTLSSKSPKTQNASSWWVSRSCSPSVRTRCLQSNDLPASASQSR